MLEDIEEKKDITPMQEAIAAWRKAHPGVEPEFDAQMVLDILNSVNEESAVRISVNPIVEDEWHSDAPMFGITGAELSDDRKLVFRVRRGKETKNADQVYEMVSKALRSLPFKHIPVCYEYNEKRQKLTDVFGHALFNDKMAGLPFDVIFAQTTPDVSKSKKKDEPEK